jgi:hypothetical protein
MFQLAGRERQNADAYWQNLLLALVGEVLEGREQVCGAVVSRRKMRDRIAVWTRKTDDAVAVAQLGNDLKTVLRLNADNIEGSSLAQPLQQMHFSYHEE